MGDLFTKILDASFVFFMNWRAFSFFKSFQKKLFKNFQKKTASSKASNDLVDLLGRGEMVERFWMGNFGASGTTPAMPFTCNGKREKRRKAQRISKNSKKNSSF